MVWTTVDLTGCTPLLFGKRSTAARLFREHWLQISRTRRSCLRTAQAGHRPGGRSRGVPGSDPHERRCALQVPSAFGS
eukprot:15327719-Alexandrium_andersonii.AAC.1